MFRSARRRSRPNARPLTATSKWFVAPRAVTAQASFRLVRSLWIGSIPDPIAAAAASSIAGYATINRFSEFRFGYELAYLHTSPARFTRSAGAERPGRPFLPRFDTAWTISTTPSCLAPAKSLAFAPAGPTPPGAPKGIPPHRRRWNEFADSRNEAPPTVQGYGGNVRSFRYRHPAVLLGGPARLNAYGTNELRTNQYWLARVGLSVRALRLPL